MTKSELIEKIAAKNPHLMLKDVDKIVGVIFDSIIDALAKGERVEFRGFGAFSVRKRSSRVAKNPRTGEDVLSPAARVPAFKAGKALKDAVAE